MKINELLVESQQLDEGPFGTAVGKAVGGLAKGVGAVAGGVAGMGKAFKKGWDSGKATVAGDPDPNDAQPAAAAAPAQGAAQPAAGAQAAPAAGAQAAPAATEPGGGAGAHPAAKDVNAAGPKGTAPAQNLKGAAKTAADKTAAATQDQNAAQAGQTVYAQVKANLDKLDTKGKQRILQLLQKSVQQKPAKAPAGAAPAAPGADAAADQGEQGAQGGAAPASGTPAAEPGAGAMGAMASQLGGKQPNTMANAPVSKTNVAKPGNPNAAPQKKAVNPDADAATQAKVAAAPNGYDQDTGKPIQDPAAEPQAAPAGQPAPTRTGGKVKGQVSMTPNAVRKREARKGKQAPQGQSQAEIDADRDRMMGNFTDSVERHKKRMVAEALSRGEMSFFRK